MRKVEIANYLDSIFMITVSFAVEEFSYAWSSPLLDKGEGLGVRLANRRKSQKTNPLPTGRQANPK